MKNLVYFLLFISTFLFAQTVPIKVTYKVIIENEKDMFNDHAQLRSYFEYSMNNSWKINFVLNVDQSGSSFLAQTNDLFDKNNASDRIMLGFTGCTGSIYSFNDSIYTNIAVLGDKIFKKTPKKNNWILQDETKKIEGYQCYKAVNVYSVENGDKVFSHPVVAWFCPELPYQYGPNGYGNLPGLILELQVRNVVFGAYKIELSNVKPVDLSIFQNAKIYTPEEIYKLLSDFNLD